MISLQGINVKSGPKKSSTCCEPSPFLTTLGGPCKPVSTGRAAWYFPNSRSTRSTWITSSFRFGKLYSNVMSRQLWLTSTTMKRTASKRSRSTSPLRWIYGRICQRFLETESSLNRRKRGSRNQWEALERRLDLSSQASWNVTSRSSILISCKSSWAKVWLSSRPCKPWLALRWRRKPTHATLAVRTIKHPHWISRQSKVVFVELSQK